MRQSPGRGLGRAIVRSDDDLTAHEKAMRELLAFYQEAGVDVAIGETPVDRLAEQPRRRRRRRRDAGASAARTGPPARRSAR